VTSLNDAGFRFKITPPIVHNLEHGLVGSEVTEALVMCFDTGKGSLVMNITLHYNRHRRTSALRLS
jgi:CheY-specific phosphatase CheX